MHELGHNVAKSYVERNQSYPKGWGGGHCLQSTLALIIPNGTSSNGTDRGLGDMSI